MELKLNLDFNQILGLIHQLPDEEIEKLLETLNKEIQQKSNSGKLKSLIKNAPNWDDNSYQEYLKSRNHFNDSRLA